MLDIVIGYAILSAVLVAEETWQFSSDEALLFVWDCFKRQKVQEFGLELEVDQSAREEQHYRNYFPAHNFSELNLSLIDMDLLFDLTLLRLRHFGELPHIPFDVFDHIN